MCRIDLILALVHTLVLQAPEQPFDGLFAIHGIAIVTEIGICMLVNPRNCFFG